jgi:phosphoenolpyruvate carboxylase
MENYPVERSSIMEREKIVLPLLIIQHYAIRKISSGKLSTDTENVYRKLIGRTVYGVVNAGRNLA